MTTKAAGSRTASRALPPRNMSVVGEWMVFRFHKKDDEIGEFFKLSGAKAGRAPHTFGVPLKNQSLIIRAYETFNFHTDAAAQEHVQNMLATRALIYDGRRIDYNSDSNKIHVLARQVNASLRKIIETMDGYRSLDSEESTCDVSSFNAAVVTKLLREYGFTCSEAGYNSFLDILSPSDKLTCLKKAEKVKPPRTYLLPKFTPFDHQSIGIHALLAFESFAIFDEMGLGKSYQMIGAASNLIEHGQCRMGVVVCPASLLYSWEAEVKKYSNLRPIVVAGTPAKRRKIYERARLPRADEKGFEIMIMSYGLARNDASHLVSLGENVRSFISLDESQNIKNPTAKVTKALLDAAPYFARRYIFTGTPVANKPEDVWAQLSFINGVNDMKDYYRFINRYVIRKKIKTFRAGRTQEIQIPVGRKNMVELRNIIAEVSLRRKKDDVIDLPEKVYQTRLIDLTGEQHRLYKEMNEEQKAELSAMPEDTVEVDSELTKLIRLAQLSSNPGLIFENYKDDPAKVRELDTIVEDQLECDIDDLLDDSLVNVPDDQLPTNGKKMVIFTSYLGNIELLRKRYAKYNPVVIQGDGMTNKDKKVSEDTLQNDPNCRMLIGQTTAAQAGFTLTAADMIVYLDRSFSLTEWLQSQDRIHRIGQTGTCTIVSLVGRGTIDEYIASVIEGKSEVATFLQGDKSTTGRAAKISRAAIMKALNNFK